MMHYVLTRIANIGRSNYYWLTLIAFALLSESIALVYQYMLDYRPCVICIHVRIWTLALIAIPAVSIAFRRSNKCLILAHLAITAVMLALMERSYQLLGTERGWTFGSCDFDLGLPGWLALEEWFPALFKVWEPCGQTPILLFNITMAEALMAITTGLALLSIIFLITTILVKNDRQQ